MKRIFTLLLSVGMILGVACSPEEELEPIFKLTSASVVQFSAEGGAGEITYSLENPAEGTNITATSEANWIKDLTVGESITFTVELNDSYEERSERITIAYGKDMHFVRVVQKGKKMVADKEQTMVDYFCTYYNKDIFVEQETNRYLLGLCDMPFGEEGEDLVADGANYYRFNLCADGYAENNNNKIPNGTYIIDHKYEYVNGTIEELNTFGSNADGSYLRIKEATVIVTNNHIEAMVVVGNSQMPDEVRHLVYEGPTVITDVDTPRIGNLITGVNVEISEETDPYCLTESTYRENAIGTGYDVHQVVVVEDYMSANGNYFSIDIVNKKDDPFGTYTPMSDTATELENTFLPGMVDEDGYMVGSWYATITNGQITFGDFMAPLQTGSITITQDGSNCIITIDCYDEVGNRITANINTPYQQGRGDQNSVPAAIMRLPER